MQVKLTSISKFLHLDSFQTEAHWKTKMTFCIVYEKSQQWKGLLVNFTSLTIRNRSSAIHVHLIKQTVDIQVRNGWVCTLENVTQFRFINSSITVHIKSLQKNQAQLLPTVLSIRQKFRNRGKWHGNFLEGFPENPKTVQFRSANHSVGNFRKEENRWSRNSRRQISENLGIY